MMEKECERAARAAGFIDLGNMWGIHNPDTASSGFGPKVYKTWMECCASEGITVPQEK